MLISSWVLSLLVIFALSLGFRAQIALKLSGYQRDSLKGYFLVNAGINRALYELNKDTNGYDALSESWSDNERVFSKISPDENEKEFCVVAYLNGEGKKVYGAIDEQGKIDINTSSPKVMEELFNSKGLSTDAKEFSKLFAEWIGSSIEAGEEKKIFKNSPLSAKEELLLVLEYFYKDRSKAREVYKNIEGLVTVYSDGKLNINTVPEEVLFIFAKAYAETEEEKSAAERLAQTVVKLREEKGFFNDITSVSFDASFDVGELSLWSKINAFLGVKSNYFRINVQAAAKEASKEANAVFKRDTKEIVYWHQN